ncbi:MULTISPECIES: YggT family protein [Bifidobacterium]|uniref:YggT family protein n=1 Tax=Bifidobacterium TaxID=1678 RepID=UPI001BDD768A|nr:MULTISPECIES: YggT family protein [Bifidobacterium]MBT1161112.1 YggT family protein [Bifidobacterium sp. SO1]MBW3078186.1 YggT family protein [Bifidobacterium simiiventris]
MLLYLLSYIVNRVIDVYIAILFIRMILDWVTVLSPRWRPTGILYSLIDVIYRLTEPPLRWLRRYIRPIPMGAVYLDVSFIVLYFALIVLRILI